MTIFDKSKITHINITDLIKTDYVWYDEIKEVRKFFNLILVREGYTAGFYNGYQTGWFSNKINKVEKGSVDIGGVLYWLPVIKVYVNSERVGIKHFDTIEEAKEFCALEFPNVDYNL
jgi:hypothetical protein